MAQTKVSVAMFLILNLLFSTVTAEYGSGGGGGGGGSGVGIPGLPIGTTPTPILPVPSPSTPSPSLPIGTTPTPTLPLPSPGTPIPGLPIGTTPMSPTPTLPLPSPATPSLPSTPVGLPSTPVGGLPTTPVGGLPSVPVGGLPTLPNPGGLLGGLTCPINVLKLSVCANVLGGLLHVNVGLGGVLGGLLGGGNQRCCSLVAGLLDLDAAVCLCTAIRANVLGINLNVPLSLNLLLNDCGKNLPSGFLCPAV